jgi:hypothetical protein
MTLDRGDHGLSEEQPRGADRPVPVGLHAAGPGSVGLLHRLEVGAGAEGPVGAGEHGDIQVFVGVEAPERVSQLLRGGPIDRVRDPGRSMVTVATAPSMS